MDVDGQLGVEGQPTDPVDQLDHDGVADLPELALQRLFRRRTALATFGGRRKGRGKVQVLEGKTRFYCQN